MSIETPNFNKEEKPDYFNSLEYLTPSELKEMEALDFGSNEKRVLFFIKFEIFFGSKTPSSISELIDRMKEQSKKRGIPYKELAREVMLDISGGLANSAN